MVIEKTAKKMIRKITLLLLFVIGAILLSSVESKTSVKSMFQKDHSSFKKLNKSWKEPSLGEKVSKDVSIIANAAALTADPKLTATLKMVFLFVLWYGFNAGYNVYNAYMKKDFQYPWAVAAIQLLVGLFYSVPLWFFKVRKFPVISMDDFLRLLPIACLNAGGHACTVNAMFEKGGGSFTHVIKASEPVVSVLLGILVNGIIPKPFTAASLLPVTYGVAYASTLGQLNPTTMGKEFTTKAAKMAMASNFAFSMRSILRKNLPAGFKERTNLDPANEHAFTTLLSFILLVPFMFTMENFSAMKTTISMLPNQNAFYLNTFICGMCYYLYNEMQNVVLGSLGPVPTAVGNTLKRVVIFVALYLFTPGETFPFPKVLGSAIAILGCLAFAVCDSKKM